MLGVFNFIDIIWLYGGIVVDIECIIGGGC